MVNEAINNLFEHNNTVKYAKCLLRMFKKWLSDLLDGLNVQLVLVKISAMILLYSKGQCKRKGNYSVHSGFLPQGKRPVA
jgi:hypothetical protein